MQPCGGGHVPARSSQAAVSKVWEAIATRQRTPRCLHLGLQFLLLAAAAHANGPVGAPWKNQVDHAEWIPRDAHGMNTLGDGSILLMAGWEGDSCVNDVWRSTAQSSGKNWTLVTDNAAFAPRKFFSTVKLYDGSLLLLGGYDGHYQYFNDVWRTTTESAGATWILQTTAAGWSKRSKFAVVALPDDSLLVMGGCCYFHDVWRSEPGRMGSRWTLQAQGAWQERADLAAVAVVNQSSPQKESVVIILGGTSGGGGRNSLFMNDVWAGSADGTQWMQQTPAAPWSGRAAPSAVVLLDGSIIVMMGTKMVGRTYMMDGDVWRSPADSLGAHWIRQTAATGWHPRVGIATLLTAGPYRGRLLIAGGFARNPDLNKNGRTNDVWRTELSCGIAAPPANGGYGTCPAVPNLFESRLKCSPLCSPGYTSHMPYSCSDGLLTDTTCEPDPCDASAAPENGGIGNCTLLLPSWSKCLSTCNSGYTISGLTSCLLGNLTAATCLPNPCDTAPPPEHGSTGTCPPRLNSHESCQPVCDRGYTVSGPTSCYLGDLTRSTCKPNPCYANLSPLNGDFGDCNQSGWLRSGDACQPTCNKGFESSSVSSCWLGNLSAAKCLPKPCNISLPEHSSSGNCPNELESGSMCTPICWDRYDLSGATSCLLGEVTESLCIPWSCNVSAPEHGAMGNCPNILESGDQCQPECELGYTFTGVPLSCWLGTLNDISCQPNPCNASVAPMHGRVGDCTQVLLSDTQCQPICNDGYTATGPTSCHLGDTTRAMCLPNPCNVSEADLADLGNCPVMLQSEEICQPSCASGYTISGAYYCLLGVSSVPTCDPNPCNETMVPLHGMPGNCVDFLLSGGFCQPTCLDGYTVSGVSSCLLGDLMHATCEPNSCYNVSLPPEHGYSGDCPDVLASGQACQPGCDPGYFVSSLTYCSLGYLELATCIPQKCHENAAPEHGSIGDCPDVLTQGISCQPECDTGYTVSGPASCNIGNLTKPVCFPDACNVSIPPEHGSQGSCPDMLPSEERCTPDCDEGYTVTGPTRCNLGSTQAATCLPEPCNITEGLLPHQQGLGDCPSVLQSGTACLPECEEGFMLSNPLFCHLGVIGIPTPAGTLRHRPAPQSCHPADIPLCMPKPCLVSEVARGRRVQELPLLGLTLSNDIAGIPCPAVLTSGSTCKINCPRGFKANWSSSCYCGKITSAECIKDRNDPWWTTYMTTSITMTTSMTTAPIHSTFDNSNNSRIDNDTSTLVSTTFSTTTSTSDNSNMATSIETTTTAVMAGTTVASSVLTPIEIKGTLSLTVPNAEDFLSDSVAQGAVRKGIAAAHNVDASQTRLQVASLRRLQEAASGDSVEVLYTISVPADSTQAAVKMLAYTVSIDELTAYINIELAEDKGASYAITVTRKEVPVVVVVTTTTTTFTTSRTTTTISAPIICPDTTLGLWDIIYFSLGGLGAGMIATCFFCCCFLFAKGRRQKPLKQEQATLREIVTTSPEKGFDELLRLNLQQQLRDAEALASSQRCLCDDLHDQLQSTFKRLDQMTQERDEKMAWGVGLQQTLQGKDEQIRKLIGANTQLEDALSKLQQFSRDEREQHSLVVGEWRELLLQEQERQKRPTPSRIPSLRSLPALETADITAEVSPTGSLRGLPWEAPIVAAEPPMPPAFTRVRHLLEGSFLQVLPGMQLLSETGVELYRPGDIGTILGLCSGQIDADSSVQADLGVSMSVDWMRTKESCVVPRVSWIWFRFIRTPEPRVGDFLQALPGADFVDASGVQHYRAGDIGEVTSISSLMGSRAFCVMWPRSGKTSAITQTHWTWFRVFRVPAVGCPEAHDVSAHIGDLIAERSEDTCFSVLWIRAGQTDQQPKVGDALQVLPGVSFTDSESMSRYEAGDVGKVISVDAAVDGQGVGSAKVLWMRTGKVSTVGDLHESLSSFRYFRMQEPRLGDLLVAAPGIEHNDVDGVEHYTAGDSGAVVSLSPMLVSGDRTISVCWTRTGKVTECSLASWSNHFSLIPLQSNVPSYIRYPLGAIEDHSYAGSRASSHRPSLT